MKQRRLLEGAMLLYTAASLLHFAHNAEYLSDYPDLPLWLTRAQIYLVWVVQAALGLAGYILFRTGRERIGLCVMGAYAALGFDGLLHYTRAPFDAHAPAMNVTICTEVAAAGLLLLLTPALLAKRMPRSVQETHRP